MASWDEKLESIDWSRLMAAGKKLDIPVNLLETAPVEVSFEDTLGLVKFNMN